VYVLASFNYSFHTELAVSELVEKGVKNEQILALPLELRGEPRRIMDTIHHSDGVSMIDGGAVLGAVFMILGVIYGFILDWGPIIWGLIGLAAGFLSGCLIDCFWGKARQSKNRRKESMGEVIVLVNCRDDQLEMVKETLWGHLALGLAVFQ
jgi:hypothetical protein